MAKKKNTRKKAQAKGDTERARKDAIKEIDQRLNGEAAPARPRSAAKGKTASKKAASKKARAKKDPKPKRMSGLDAAAQVLAEAGKPLNCRAIIEAIIKKSLWGTKGKTPHATLSAAMSREIKAKGKDARFKKAGRGLFASNA